MAKKLLTKYTVIRDTREQKGWDFSADQACDGTMEGKLDTGDYTIYGAAKFFTVERKGSTGEWAANIFQARFERELERMAKFEHPYIVFEFTLADMIAFPEGSGIPERRWRRLRVTKWLMLKRTIELMQQNPKVHFVFAGKDARSFVISLFKRIVEQYGCQGPETTN
jgi:hypothetical protein